MFLSFQQALLPARLQAERDIIQQVEWLLGPLSTETSVIEGDDDESILKYNVRVILDELIRKADVLSCVKTR